MLTRPVDREVLIRLMLLVLASYAGSVAGNIAGHDWQFELEMLNPLAILATIMASAITPIAGVILAATAILAIACLAGRVPRASAILCGIGLGLATLVIVLRWRTG